MYDELVKVLRGCVLSKPCDGCPYYDKDGPTEKCATLNIDAADAIEELNSQLEDFKRMCLPLKENRLYKYSGGSLVEVFLMTLPTPPKEE